MKKSQLFAFAFLAMLLCYCSSEIMSSRKLISELDKEGFERFLANSEVMGLSNQD